MREKEDEVRSAARDREKAVLVSLRWGRTGEEEAEDSLRELASLSETAGAEVRATMLQSRTRPDPSTLLGRGKIEELRRLVAETDAELVIFDQELTPSQQRNLERELEVKVVDRTALILDIFAQHAQSQEGKAQVEMAQLRYRLSHLTGRGAELSRLGGGIGTRGPGETKLEVDRRRIHARIKALDRELRELTRVRRVKRKRRQRLTVPTFSLVGYTNAGKSSLLNALTGAGVKVEDQLFSTLDPTTRRLLLPGNRRVVITDTVGFINNLPHQLVEAFKSTLEEVREADFLLHVIDASTPGIGRRRVAVEEVLEEIEAGDVPVLYVLNKVDLVQADERGELAREYPSAVFTSTVTGEGLEELRARMSSLLTGMRLLDLRFPAVRGDLVSLLYNRGLVMDLRLEDGEYRLKAEVPQELVHRFQPYIKKD